MDKIVTEHFYIKDTFVKHKEIKDTLLNLISKHPDTPLVHKDDFYTHDITKTDWSEHEDFKNREWINFLLPHLFENLDPFIKELGFLGVSLKALWFQQYEKNSTHDWHTHGENYSGVYYLELPKDAPKTKFWTGSNFITPDVKEGDICIFPAMSPHKAPPVLTDGRKTIISYNFNLTELNGDALERMRTYD